ncbi:universal stress protein [Leptolyngbya sp. Heron Island J]|uniref:universal stress protein n=1 Tax=Leptolyngbya sp. Heron Island J TaxID=1385935 RepID=UPI0003B94B9A|nr:universal stress protein [Leptolyngbya sp. Heron Island J]ESA36434.1 universal stress protein [Leptolyngbya sp. Heron Island J]
MIRKIVVGLDRSTLSSQALQSAIAFAQSYNAELKLVHVLVNSEPDAPQFSGYFGGPLYPSISSTVVESYQTAWNQFVDHAQSVLNQQVETACQCGITATGTLLYGNPGAKLCETAQSWDADLVVVGSRGLSGIRELLIGSVSNHVLHHAPCSVLVVHPTSQSLVHPTSQTAPEKNKPNDSEPIQPMQRILVALDRSDMARQAMLMALNLAKQHQAEIRLVHILDGDEPGMPSKLLFSDSQYIGQHSERLFAEYQQEWNHFINDWWQWLQQRVDEIEAEGVEAICDVMQGRTGYRICEIAQDWPADLIVIGCRGLSGLQELLMGSVSYYVSHRAPCAVLVTRTQLPAQKSHQTQTAAQNAELSTSAAQLR